MDSDVALYTTSGVRSHYVFEHVFCLNSLRWFLCCLIYTLRLVLLLAYRKRE
jgi:hypothetical protein